VLCCCAVNEFNGLPIASVQLCSFGGTAAHK
jgi:hypothetical protein